MFAVIRHYHFNPKDSAEIDRQIREEFVPIVKKAKGFVRYYWLDTGKGEGASFSVFKDKLVPMSQCAWLRTTYMSILLNFSSETRDHRRADQSSRLSADTQ